MTTKSLENKCRRHLAKYGYALRKGKARPTDDESGYMIVNADTNSIVEGYDACYGCFQLTLDDVVEWIKEKPFVISR